MNTIKYWDSLIQKGLNESWDLSNETKKLIETTKDKVDQVLNYFNEIILTWLKKKANRLKTKILSAAENQINFNKLNWQFAQWLDEWKLIHKNWKVENTNSTV